MFDRIKVIHVPHWVETYELQLRVLQDKLKAERQDRIGTYFINIETPDILANNEELKLITETAKEEDKTLIMEGENESVRNVLSIDIWINRGWELQWTKEELFEFEK